MKPLNWESELAWEKMHTDNAVLFNASLLVVEYYSSIFLDVNVVVSTDSTYYGEF